MKIETLVWLLAYIAGFFVGVAVDNPSTMLILICIPVVYVLYKAVTVQQDNNDLLKKIAKQMKENGVTSFTGVIKEEKENV